MFMFFILALVCPLAIYWVLIVIIRGFLWRLLCRAYLHLLDQLTLAPDSLFLGAICMEECAKTISHTMSPHSYVICPITPYEPSKTMPLVILVLSFMDVATRKDGAADALNPLILIKLPIQEVAIAWLAKLELQSFFCDEGPRVLGFYLIDV